MDWTGVRSEAHVAQQRRRERLRVQQINSVQLIMTDDRPFFFHSELRPDLGQVGNASSLFDPSFLPSEMIGFSSDFNALPAQSDSIGRQQMSENTLFHRRSISSNFNSSSKVQQQAGDWMLTCGSSSWSAENNPNLMISDEVGNASFHQPYLNPSDCHYYNFSGDQLPEPDRYNHAGETQFVSSPFQNNLPDVVVPASIPESGQGRWSSASELASFSWFKDQEDLLRFQNSSYWGDRSVPNSSQQGLSLSLSSNPPSKSPASQLEDGCASEDLEQSGGFYMYHQDPVAGISGSFNSISKPSAISKRCGKSIQEIIGVSSNTCRNTGPLGPFTGYSIILKRSKFLKPAQQLLDQISGKSGLKFGGTRDVLNRTSGEVSVSVSADVSDATGAEVSVFTSSSPIFYGSNETSGVKSGSFFSVPVRPDIQRKKATLLYIMEEVCRRYRQYNQQMQMAVSSFESVAGLGSAMPFMSFALKTVSRQFRCLKNVVSDQLRHVRRGTAEELTSQKLEGSSGQIREGEESLKNYGYGDEGDGFLKYYGCGDDGDGCRLLQPHQHLWKPQRGLPERAVVILRAWLFEHFLHPYPTDADKLMLATQTGLSRNQVSNWFINARVRVWKPMVEDIHILEAAKDPSETNQIHDLRKHSESFSQRNPGGIDDQGQPLQCLHEDNPWCSSHEKRSRVEIEEPSPASFNEPPMVGFMPYDGGVSLTLGLRHGVENSQQQLLLQHQTQLRRQCGDHFLRDFVG